MTIRIPSMMDNQDSLAPGHAASPSQAGSAPDESSPDSSNTPLSTPFAHDTMGLDHESTGFRHRHSGALILTMVIGVAGAMLFAMRSLGQAGKIALLDIKIDYPLDSAGASKSLKDQQVVLQDLRNSGKVRQVPLEEVQMNPFEWRGLGPAEAATGPVGVDPAEVARRALESRRREIQEGFARLHLNSIIGGAVPVASISGEMVKVGGKIGEHFIVRSIDGRSVVLVGDDQVFTLTLGK